MAFRIFVGCCIFGVGWYAVDRVRPGLLQQIDVAGKIAALRTSAVPAIEVKEGKDTKDTAVQGTSVGESGSATQGHVAPASDLGVGSMENIYVIGARMWSNAQSLCEHLMDTLVPTDLQRRLRAAWTALQGVEWTAIIRSEKARVLMASIVCFAVSRLFCGGCAEANPSDDDTSPGNTAPATAAGWKSIFSILSMARGRFFGYRYEGGHICPRGKAADQLLREGVAAAVIQRWFRTEFKRWLRNGTPSRLRVATSPSSSQRWIDEDYGAVFGTVLEDPSVSADALGPPGAEHCSEDELFSYGKRPSESSDQGGEEEASLRVRECRKALPPSSAKLPKAVLRLKSPVVQRGKKSVASINP
ncbi:uncharacterized protein [Dermacentor albipictus]|uniref:uncharacterized protein n=1 Tax=Dermacentor albipictus TaxID=60249 RepID=UPI0031FBFEED